MIGGDLLNGDGVDRPAPGKAPTAFRLWRAGVNETDIGPCNLTPAALAGLLASQDLRGNRYSFDLAHGSLNPQSPPDLQVAYGDHRLQGRNGELWAVDCQWSEWARAQIEKVPPGLRYYSPAYDVDKATREPTRYVNCALTPNPATWNATALAAAKGTTMDPEKDKPPGDGADSGSGPSVDVSTVVAGLHKLMTEAKDDGEREMYRKALAALMAPKNAAEGAQAAEGEGGDDKGPPSSKDGGALAKAAKAATPPAAAAASVTASPAGSAGATDPLVVELAKQVQAITRRQADQDRAALASERASLAARPGLAPELAAIVRDPVTPIVTARSLAATAKPPAGKPITTESVAGTRGQNQGEHATAQLPAEQAAALNVAMGLPTTADTKAHVDTFGQYVMPIETPTQTRARLAAAQKAKVA